MDIKLTDDELGALSAMSGMPCPLPIFTVNGADTEAMQQAIFRGHRSLKVRDLLSEETSFQAPVAELSELFTDITQSPMNLLGFISRGDQAGYIGMGLVAVPIEGRVLLDDMSPDGIHDLRMVTPEAAQEHIDGWVQDFYAATPQDDTAGVSLIISSSAGVTAFRVLPGSVSQGHIAVEAEESQYVEERDLGDDLSPMTDFINELLNRAPEIP